MKIIVGNNGPVSSDDRPVMLKVSKDEIERIRSTPDGHDIVVFFPRHWQEDVGKRWSHSKLGLINGKTPVVSMESEEAPQEPPKAEEPEVEPPTVAEPPVAEVAPEPHPEPQPPAVEETADEGKVSNNEILSIFGLDSSPSDDKQVVEVDAEIVEKQ